MEMSIEKRKLQFNQDADAMRMAVVAAEFAGAFLFPQHRGVINCDDLNHEWSGIVLRDFQRIGRQNGALTTRGDRKINGHNIRWWSIERERIGS